VKKTLKRLAIVIAPIVALILAGGADWKIG